MRRERIQTLRYYREMLLECKRKQLSNELSNEIENKFTSKYKPKQKILTLFR